jgi:peptidoglycan/xylan/chitin deacetylase (PgdA/CDA1 family)
VFVPLLLATSVILAVIYDRAVLDIAGPVARAADRSDARALFPPFDSAVPVLLYHRLTPSTNGYGVAPADFEAQMQRLHELGFQAITLDEYARFVRGDAVDLPPRPILITFDDGYLSSLTVADPVFARYGWSAAIYIPTGAVGRPGRLTWGQLRRMQASGRWQIDEHAGDGHVLVRVDASGRRLPFYSSKMWVNGAQESFARYRQRVRNDIERGRAALARNIPGWTSHGTFAVPFNSYGQHGSNDPRIEAWLTTYLQARFTAVLVQRDDSFVTPGAGLENRIHVPGSWTPDVLQVRLVDGRDRLMRDR